jgi:hypothetical protein
MELQRQLREVDADRAQSVEEGMVLRYCCLVACQVKY